MDIEELEKLEIEACNLLERIARERGIEYGQFAFNIYAGRIKDWIFTERRKLLNLKEFTKK